MQEKLANKSIVFFWWPSSPLFPVFFGLLFGNISTLEDHINSFMPLWGHLEPKCTGGYFWLLLWNSKWSYPQSGRIGIDIWKNRYLKRPVCCGALINSAEIWDCVANLLEYCAISDPTPASPTKGLCPQTS